MRQTFRKKLYNETKEQHLAVEEVFDFRKGINETNLNRFLRAMFIARSYYQSDLNDFEKNFNIKTYNAKLIHALKKDIGANDLEGFDGLAKLESPNQSQLNESQQLGVFYVFAGSSAGARFILGQLNEQSLSIQRNYLTALVNSSSDQMSSLKEVFKNAAFVEDDVIKAAQETFNFILTSTSYGFS